MNTERDLTRQETADTIGNEFEVADAIAKALERQCDRACKLTDDLDAKFIAMLEGNSPPADLNRLISQCQRAEGRLKALVAVKALVAAYNAAFDERGDEET
jgi:hypothetical protein